VAHVVTPFDDDPANLFGGAYSGRTVLVTGHTGFTGSWLSLWLRRLGATVVGLSLPPATEPNLYERAGVERVVTSILADVRDADAVRAAVETHRPDVVFHLAAQPIVLESYRDPATTFATNVLGTVNVLEAVRTVGGVRACVVVTSDKCYAETPDGRALTEDGPLGGHDPYSASKAAAEIVVGSYRASFFSEGPTAAASVRAGNIIGGGDWSPSRIVPDAVEALLTRRTLTLRHPDAVRPWQHVLDPVAGYLWLGARLAEEGDRFGGGWNLGPTNSAPARTVRELVDAIGAAWGQAVPLHVEAPTRHENQCLLLDVERASRALGWQPVLDFGASVQLTANWYRRFADAPGEAAAATLAQIQSFEHRARRAGVAWAAAPVVAPEVMAR
jgi:CDP-glucose 4,6-dehydratase